MNTLSFSLYKHTTVFHFTNIATSSQRCMSTLYYAMAQYTAVVSLCLHSCTKETHRAHTTSYRAAVVLSMHMPSGLITPLAHASRSPARSTPSPLYLTYADIC